MGAITKDVKLADGSIVHLDISELRRREWEDFWSSPEGENRVIAKFSNMSLDEVKDMLDRDFRLLVQEFIKLRNKPLDDPNSQSAST